MAVMKVIMVASVEDLADSVVDQKASGQKKSPVEMSFRDLEKVLGFKLPDSAYRQRTWWSNNVHNNVMTRVWKNAGFVTEEVDMAKEKVAKL